MLRHNGELQCYKPMIVAILGSMTERQGFSLADADHAAALLPGHVGQQPPSVLPYSWALTTEPALLGIYSLIKGTPKFFPQSLDHAFVLHTILDLIPVLPPLPGTHSVTLLQLLCGAVAVLVYPVHNPFVEM